MTLGIGSMILAEASLSFLGLGSGNRRSQVGGKC